MCLGKFPALNERRSHADLRGQPEKPHNNCCLIELAECLHRNQSSQHNQHNEAQPKRHELGREPPGKRRRGSVSKRGRVRLLLRSLARRREGLSARHVDAGRLPHPSCPFVHPLQLKLSSRILAPPFEEKRDSRDWPSS